MDELPERLQALNAFDVALLLQEALNGIRERLEREETEETQRMLSWWETAMGVDLEKARKTIRELHEAQSYQPAAQEFLSSQQFRATALDYLKTAIESNSHRQYDRWRWSARAYGYAVCDFLVVQKMAATLSLLENNLAEEEPTNVLTNFRVLHRNFQYRLMRFHNEHEIPPRYHNGLRAQAILQKGQSLEEERMQQIIQRDALLHEVQHRAGDAEAQKVLGSNLTLEQQIRALEDILKQNEQREQEAQISQQAEEHQQQLYDAFHFDAENMDPAFLSALLNILSVI
ncbi:hypothetical protein [Rhodocaloribacter sp.]